MMDSLKTRRKSITGFTVIIAVVFSFFLAGCKVETTPEHPDGEETKQFTVTFIKNDGSEETETTVKVDEGKSLERPAAPVREGYSFDDWYTDEELSQVYDFATPVTADVKLYAKWSIQSFNVTFYTDGGTEIEAQTVEYNTFAKKPSKNPVKENCSFNGWFQDKEGTVKFDFNTAITANTVIYAGWKFLGYKITFNTDGGTDINSQSVKEDEGLVTQPQEPTKTGYTFSGWYADEACTIAFDFEAKVEANTTIYAKWTIKSYKINFYSEYDSTTVFTSLEAEYGSKITEPEEAPVKEHYTFAGWYSDMALRTPFDFDSAITGDLSLYAKWTPVSYTVSFIVDDKTIAQSTLNYLTLVNKPTNPRKTGYSFSGWYLDKEVTKEYDFTKGISENINLYAKWTINKYTVSFNSNGGSSIESITADYNTLIKAPAAPTKEHSTFAGWYVDSKLTKEFVSTSAITENLTLYAKWNVKQYTVSFNSNGGATVTALSVQYNTTARAPAAPEKAGYTFEGWYTDSELSNAFSFISRITADITLYAKWSINEYTVSFNSNGGSSITSITTDWNTSITAPNSPTKQYFKFGGWYTDSNFTAAYSFDSPVTESFTLYAKWEVIPHTVNFNTNGGNPITAVSVNEGSRLSAPATPVRTGYDFLGWYSDSDLKSIYSFSSLVLTDMTLYAKWEISKYTVTFYTDGGSYISSQTVEYGSKATRPAANPTKKNCNFIDWFTSPNADVSSTENKFDFNTAITSSVTIYAGWEINGWIVRFETNGAGELPFQVFSKDGTEKLEEPAAPKKLYHNFDGWYTDFYFNTNYNFDSPVTQSFTLYAKWNTIPHSVTFDSNGGSPISPAIITVDEGQPIPLPANPVKEHMVFAGWYTDSSLTSAYNNGLVLADMNLYAKWEDLMHKVSFNTHGGNSIAAIWVKDGQSIQASAMPANPSLTGYTFGGWYTDSGLATAFDASSEITGNITLHAKWNINYYKVEFNVDGGSYVNFQNVAYNSTALKPADPTKNHMVFAGWYTDAGLTSSFNFGTKITEAITLYAKWTDLMRTITFETKGGSTIAPIQVKDATVIPASVMPANPTRRGYTFENWYTDSGLTSVFDASSTITDNITLYAKWNINTYTVSFETAGGSTVDSVTVNWNTSVTEPVAPTKDHMDFAGWYSNKGLSTAYNFSSKITADTILYAKWTPKERTISFNTNGGSSVNTLTFNEGTSALRPANPTKGDEIFVGWFTDEALTQAFNFTADSAKLTQDITLYAKWKDYALITSVTVLEQSEPFKVTVTKDSYGKITFASDSVGGWCVDMTYLYNASSYTFDPAEYEKGIYIITLNVVINGHNYSYKAQVEVQ